MYNITYSLAESMLKLYKLTAYVQKSKRNTYVAINTFCQNSKAI